MSVTEITIFKPNGRDKQTTISHLVPKVATDALAERLGTDAGKKAASLINAMKRNGGDLAQFREGDRRVRVKFIAR